ncbi:C-terminal helicase domain-containing protein, partial [Acinetobacter baumannii]
CCDPRLLKLESAKKTDAGSAKLQYLCETLPSLVEEGRKILLFSQFTEMLSLIEAAIKPLNIPYVILTGQTQDRVTPVQQFQAGEVPL